MIRLDTGGGALATFVICALVILGAVWFIAEVVNPIICYLSSGDCS